MNEQYIRDRIKLGVKNPSPDFTDKVMSEISALQNVVPTGNKWIFRILLFACCLIFILSMFISIPQIQAFNLSIGYSPVIMPIISLIFIFVIFQKLYDIRNCVTDNSKSSMV
jgi:TRAP-type C4-dicarboxylate transport system permease small subunit